MRRYIFLAMAVIAVSTIVVSHAFAVVRPATYMTSQRLQAACGKAGGTFGESHGRYFCDKANCDGKGNNCAYVCYEQKKSCQGDTPDRVRPGASIQQILNNGKYAKPSQKGTIGDARVTPTPSRMIGTSGTLAPKQPAIGTRSLVMPAISAPSQPTLQMKKR